jgi:mono/diheme cytochrome c family protein
LTQSGHTLAPASASLHCGEGRKGAAETLGFAQLIHINAYSDLGGLIRATFAAHPPWLEETMNSKLIKAFTVGAFAVCAATMAHAQQIGPARQSADIGKYDYETYCAVCHGLDGKGGGPFSMLVTKKVTDLTVLSKNNGGVFPFNRTYEAVDGSADIAGHGTREMPIWGDVYKEKASNQLGPYYTPSDSSSYVRGRILALIGYISTLQQK